MLKLCILFGGANSEHEVSLRSATSVLENIDRARYSVVMLGITKAGRWLRYRGEIADIITGAWESHDCTPAVIAPDSTCGGLLELTPDGPVTEKLDVCFPVLHGKNGEDGTVQGLLELAGIPCVGCGVLASATCMDKEVTHKILLSAGVRKTRLLAYHRHEAADIERLTAELEREIGYPMFVKPANAGSSVGVTKVKTRQEIAPAFTLAFEHDGKIVVEAMMYGAEVECAVMGNEQPYAAEIVGELVPANEFYDYAGKYLEDSTAQHIPARISPAETDALRAMAVKAYAAMGCAGFARVDFFVQADGTVLLNEINTIPGFTSISMFPKLFIASGVPYAEILDRLIALALEPEQVLRKGDITHG